MNYLKEVIIIWACIHFVSSAPPVVIRGSVNLFDISQKYCGLLLKKSIEYMCLPNTRIDDRLRSNLTGSTALSTRWNPGPIKYEKSRTLSTLNKNKYTFLENRCCIQGCSLNFIKSNCPGTRTRMTTVVNLKINNIQTTAKIISTSTTRTTTTTEEDYWLFILPSS